MKRHSTSGVDDDEWSIVSIYRAVEVVAVEERRCY